MKKFKFLTLFTLMLALLITPAIAQDNMLGDEPNLGETVTVEGEVTEILSPYAFRMERTEPFDFTPSEVVVFNDDTEPFAADVNVGRIVQVTGVVDALILDNVIDRVGYEIESTLFNSYDAEDYSLIATSVTDATQMEQAGNFEYDEEMVEQLEDNPEEYYGQTVTVEGYVGEILDSNTFRLEDTEPFDLTPASFVVANNDGEAFGIDINVGRHVRVTGVFTDLSEGMLTEYTTYEYDPGIFETFQDDFGLVAESVTAISARNADTTYGMSDMDDEDTMEDDTMMAVTSMDDIEDNPGAFIGQTVTVEGEIEETYGTTGFLFEEEEFFDLNPLQIVVFTADGVTFPADGGEELFGDDEFAVTGTLYAFNIVDLEAELGYDLDDALFEGYDENDLAMVATSVTLIED